MTDLNSNPPVMFNTAGTNSSFPVGSVYSWNGPVCNVCGQGYIGKHTCKVSVLKDKIAELQKVIDRIEAEPAPMKCCPPNTAPGTWTTPAWTPYDTSGCGCRKENGGSGVCGCIFGGPQIIC